MNFQFSGYCRNKSIVWGRLKVEWNNDKDEDDAIVDDNDEGDGDDEEREDEKNHKKSWEKQLQAFEQKFLKWSKNWTSNNDWFQINRVSDAQLVCGVRNF